MKARILVLEDDESLRLVITKALSRAGHDVRATASAQSAIDRMLRAEADLLVADVVLGQENFLDRIDEITRARPDAPVIVISAQTTAATAIDAARRGARRYLPKPFDLDDLIGAVEESLAGREAAPPRSPKAGQGGFAGLIGRSGAMQHVFQAIGTLTKSRLPVLLTGPEGSGRATAARALHAARGGQGLMEAGPARLAGEGLRLFDGAPGAVLLRRADRWTEPAQDAVLEYLESGPEACVYVTGSPDSRTRLAPALFHRIAAAQIAVPPLRDRQGDARLIFEHVLADRGLSAALPADIADIVTRWTWPGEVLELERVAGQLALDGRISAERLLSLISETPDAGPDLAATVEQAAARYFAKGEEAGRPIQDEVDAALIRAALARTGGVRRDAAVLLGWNRNTLARRIEALGLDI